MTVLSGGISGGHLWDMTGRQVGGDIGLIVLTLVPMLEMTPGDLFPADAAWCCEVGESQGLVICARCAPFATLKQFMEDGNGEEA